MSCIVCLFQMNFRSNSLNDCFFPSNGITPLNYYLIVKSFGSLYLLRSKQKRCEKQKKNNFTHHLNETDFKSPKWSCFVSGFKRIYGKKNVNHNLRISQWSNSTKFSICVILIKILDTVWYNFL